MLVSPTSAAASLKWRYSTMGTWGDPIPRTLTETHRAGLPLKPLIFPQVKWHDPEGWWQSISPMCSIQDMLWHCHAAGTLGNVNSTAQDTAGCFGISLPSREQQRTPCRPQVNKLHVEVPSANQTFEVTLKFPAMPPKFVSPPQGEDQTP